MAKKGGDDFEVAHEAIISKWTRQKDQAEDKVNHMGELLKNTISKMLQNKNIKSNVARDLKNATQNRFDPNSISSGFKATDEMDSEIVDYINNSSFHYEEDDE